MMLNDIESSGSNSGLQSSPDPKSGELTTDIVMLGGPASQEKTEKKKKPAAFYMSILALMLLTVITAWDATSIAVALPVITSELRGTTLESFWANISFVLGVVVTQPIYMSASDVFGRKPPLYASMLLFAAGAVVFAAADSMPAVIAGRLVQGLGGGGLDVLQEIVLTDITSLKERPMYLGFIGLAIAAGSIAGPVVGAVLSEFASWRWIGWVNLPIVGVAFVLSLLFLRLRSIEMTFRAKIVRLDWVGMLLYAVGATALTLPLSWGDALYPWASWRTVLPLAIGCVLLVLFAFYEKKPLEPVMPYRLFSNVTSIATLVSGAIHGAILYTILLYLPLFFQAVFLETPLDAAKSILPVCSLVVAFSFLAPVIIETTRRYRLLLWFGWIMVTLFLGLWCMVGQSTSRAEIYTLQALSGVGIGIVFTGTQVPMQASVLRVDDTGLAVGLLVVFRQLGALVGLAIGSTIFNSVFQRSILSVESIPELEKANQAVNFIPTMRTLDLPVETMDSLIEAYRKPFQAIWIAMTCFSGLGFFVSLFIQDLTLESEEIGRQGLE